MILSSERINICILSVYYKKTIFFTFIFKSLGVIGLQYPLVSEHDLFLYSQIHGFRYMYYYQSSRDDPQPHPQNSSLYYIPAHQAARMIRQLLNIGLVYSSTECKNALKPSENNIFHTMRVTLQSCVVFKDRKLIKKATFSIPTHNKQ